MTEVENEFEMLKRAQPAWRADGLGVRGNPIDFQKEQTRVDWPAAEFTRREGKELAGPATAGSPQRPPYVTAG